LLIRQQAPGTRVLLIASDPTGEVLFDAVSVGVGGVLGCETTRDELIDAVHWLGAGGTVPAPSRSGPNQGHVTTRRRLRGGRPGGRARSLSRQEVSIVKAIAEGHTDREIADHLAIPIATVKSHVRSILRKTGTANRAGAITAAFRSQVLE
jgi:DNA-binding NarL/FixJ family response regulator